MPAYLPVETPVNAARVGLGALTLKEVFRAVLYDLNKDVGENFRVPDFNHYYRRGLASWKEKLAKNYDATQQTADDMRPLSHTKIYTASSTPALDVTKKTFTLPPYYDSADSVIVNFRVVNAFLAFKTNDVIHYPAKRLTADLEAAILKDYHQRPNYERPFYWVRNGYIELQTGIAHANLVVQSVVLNFRCQPEALLLTQAMIDDDTTDTSPILEYPAAVCDSIAKEIALLYMEANSDQRVRTYPQIAGVMPSPPRDMPIPVPGQAAPVAAAPAPGN